jgi:hypothetical protein
MGDRDMGQFWYCNACDAQNHVSDGTCQYCDCGGAECERDSCDDVRHFCPDTDAHAHCETARDCRLSAR